MKVCSQLELSLTPNLPKCPTELLRQCHAAPLTTKSTMYVMSKMMTTTREKWRYQESQDIVPMNVTNPHVT